LSNWKFRQNTNAHTWDNIGRQIEKRKMEGKDSDVFLNEKKLKRAKVAKEIRRIRPSKVSTQSGALG
jgi:hypothetical protein